MSLISLREFARRNTVSPEAISKAMKTGRLPSVEGKIDPAVAQPAWDAIRDPARAGRKLPRAKATSIPHGQQRREQPTPAPPAFPAEFGLQSFGLVRTEREKVRLARDRVELQRLLGALVDVTMVRGEIETAIHNARAKLLALGHKLAPQLAIETDAGRCKELVDDAVREALMDLAASGGQP